MSSFLDLYLPDRIKGYPWTSSPRTSTTITGVANGSEHRNRNWLHPLHHFQAPESVRCIDDIQDLKDHFLITGGPHLAFPMRDPFDFASRRLVGAGVSPGLFATDQVLGVGDGQNREFQLQKKYTRGGRDYFRPIVLPVVSTVQIAMNAHSPTVADPTLPGGPFLWDVSRIGGVVTFDHAPVSGTVITAGFLFDVPVRFESDDALDLVLKGFQLTGMADLAFEEVRPCFVGEET